MELKSSAFENGGQIPPKYTCEGENISPPLQISEVPEEAQSLVLIAHDPDVPKELREDGLWVHWVVFNIPPDTKELPENGTPPGFQGISTGGKNSYEGPCPPDRQHRYYFTLYALNTTLSLQNGATRDEVEQEIIGHILTQTQLMGHFVLEKNK